MFVYLFIFFLVTVLYWQDSNRSYTALFTITTFIMIAVAGLRDMIGGYDVYIYAEIFEVSSEAYQYIDFDPLFLLYYRILKIFSDNRVFMFFISAAITIGGYFWFFKKNSPWLYFSVFLFFAKLFLMTFVYVRQFVAMLVILVAIHFLIKKKYLIPIVLTGVAFFFHKSSVILLPFIFLAHFRFSNLQILLLAMVITGLSLSGLGNLLTAEVATSVGSEKLEMYANKSSSINLFYVIEGFLVIVISLLFRSDFYKKEETVIYFNGLLFYGFIILLALSTGTFVRLAWYYFVFICLGLPYIYLFINQLNFKRLFKAFVFVYYSLIFFRLLIVYDNGDFMPYKSVFQNFDRNGMWEHMEYRNKY